MARFGWTILCVAISAVIAFLVVHQSHKKRDAFALSTLKVKVGEGHGSGVHTGNRYIITAAHVVGKAKTATVTASHGGAETADVLWANEKYDIALLRARALTGVDVSRLNCTSSANVGQAIIAVGNPGPLEFISTFGRVSSGLKHGEHWADFIIVAMAVAPGMSGGPIIDERGSVSGIVVGVALSPMGYSASMVPLAYVVPSKTVCSLLAR